MCDDGRVSAGQSVENHRGRSVQDVWAGKFCVVWGLVLVYDRLVLARRYALLISERGQHGWQRSEACCIVCICMLMYSKHTVIWHQYRGCITDIGMLLNIVSTSLAPTVGCSERPLPFFELQAYLVRFFLRLPLFGSLQD